MSIILAIETSTEIASVALMADGKLWAREVSGVQTHSQTVLPLVMELLAESGMALRQCDAFAFGCGPGSFTGVRTACGIVQGLAFGTDRPVVPVVTLEAMACGYLEATGRTDVVTVLDARMGEVYWGQYSLTHHSVISELQIEALVPPTLSSPEQVLPVKAAYSCGNGLKAYRERLGFGLLLEHDSPDADLMPHARQIARIAQRRVEAGQVLPAHEAQPFYLRDKVAMTTAERTARSAA